MKRTFAHYIVVGLWLLGLTGAMALAEEKPASAPSPEVKAVIEELQALRVPETIAYLKTVDPKLLAEALKTPEGECALGLACRWSTRRPTGRDPASRLALWKYQEELSREFAQLPDAIIQSLRVWRAYAVCDGLKLPEEEEQELLDTQEAMRQGFFLARLTPEQREAAYEIVDLRMEQFKRDPILEGVDQDTDTPEAKAETARQEEEWFGLFRRWGPEKFRHVLEGEWSAIQFLIAFAHLSALEDIYLGAHTHWNLAKMPGWFWEEVARFTKRPNAYLPFLNLYNGPFGTGFNASVALANLAETLKDKEMEEALIAIDHRINAAPRDSAIIQW